MPSNSTRTQRRRYAFAAAHLTSTMLALNHHCQTALAFTLRRSSPSSSAFLVHSNRSIKIKHSRQITTASSRLFSSVTEQPQTTPSTAADDGSVYKLKPRPTPTQDSQYDLTNLSNGICMIFQRMADQTTESGAPGPAPPTTGDL